MIPKVIHYCWFGGGKKPKLAKKCISSWKTYCPGYKLIEWNESNYDLSSAPQFVREAAEAKKWAFVSDYVRLQVVYQYGGIYLDTDVELLRNIDFLLDQTGYFGFEFTNKIATGLGFGAEKGLSILCELKQGYESSSFVLPDGGFNTVVCVDKDRKVFESYGLVENGTEQIINQGIHVYPAEYFCPGRWKGKMNITEKTVSIHWYASSWYTKEMLKRSKHTQIRIMIHPFLSVLKRVLIVFLGKARHIRSLSK